MTSLGIVLPQHEASVDDLLRAAQLAEESGLDSVWVADHLWGRRRGSEAPGRPILDGWSALSAVAEVTEHVILGTLVMRVGLRLPRVAAAMVDSLSKIAPGRLMIALGVGDQTVRGEQEASGIPLQSRELRLQQLEITVDHIKKLTPDVPLLVGGVSRALLEAAARAGGWNFWGPAGEFEGHLQRFREVAGDTSPQTSWAGMWPGEQGLKQVMSAGAGHAIVAAGSQNYRERIDSVAQLKR